MASEKIIVSFLFFFFFNKFFSLIAIENGFLFQLQIFFEFVLTKSALARLI